ncbi:hypothetical protein BDV35DRAFT_338181 [Aspergillus flavus]|uniref:Uncharacterized protein n=1 Tax=Aspergillus flavus TaxID=5059 RepID=A0A5N6HD38_ASPFL|nr:hypothetical protein BDV35DRAFT_338181 [Aspergillus flavus]
MKAPSQLSEYWCWVPECPPKSAVATSTSQLRTINTGPKPTTKTNTRYPDSKTSSPSRSTKASSP